MKKILLFLAFCLAITANAATTTPVQLLSPTGSTSGQVIKSNGPTSEPSWGSFAVGSLSAIGANTALGNFTGVSAAPSAFAVPSCSTANSALKYTSGTGLSCGTTFALTSGNLSQFAATTSAQLIGVLSDETGSGSAVFGTSPSLTTPTIAGAALSGTLSGTPTFSGAVTFTSSITPAQAAGIIGTTTNNNAAAGSFGEYVTNTGTTVPLTSGVSVNITSITLTAGDWDVEGTLQTNPAGGTTTSLVILGTSTGSAAFAGLGTVTQLGSAIPAGVSAIAPTPVFRYSLPSTQTIFLVASVNFASSTMTGSGVIRARRVR